MADFQKNTFFKLSVIFEWVCTDEISAILLYISFVFVELENNVCWSCTIVCDYYHFFWKRKFLVFRCGFWRTRCLFSLNGFRFPLAYIKNSIGAVPLLVKYSSFFKKLKNSAIRKMIFNNELSLIINMFFKDI